MTDPDSARRYGTRSHVILAVVFIGLVLGAPGAVAQINFSGGDRLANSGGTDLEQVEPFVSCGFRFEVPGSAACLLGWSDYNATGGFDESQLKIKQISESTGWNLGINPEFVLTAAAQYQQQNAHGVVVPTVAGFVLEPVTAVEWYESGSNDADVGIVEADGTVTIGFEAGFQADPHLSWTSVLNRGQWCYSSSESPVAGQPDTDGACVEIVHDDVNGLGSFAAYPIETSGAVFVGLPESDGFTLSFRGPSPQYRSVVVWQSTGSDGDDDDQFSVQARLFEQGGSPLAAPFQVNQSTAGLQWRPGVAVHETGGPILIVWEDWNSGAAVPARIMGRLYDVTGAALGAEFPISEAPNRFAITPSVAVRDGGEFVVVWIQLDATFSSGQVLARVISDAGVPQGGEFRVNDFEYTASVPESPDVAAVGREVFVVWQGSGAHNGDASGSSIQMRGTFGLIFGDGFELLPD